MVCNTCKVDVLACWCHWKAMRCLCWYTEVQLKKEVQKDKYNSIVKQVQEWKINPVHVFLWQQWKRDRCIFCNVHKFYAQVNECVELKKIKDNII